MHQLHHQAAEHHELAARLHRDLAEATSQEDDESTHLAVESSSRAYALAHEAHNKSSRIMSL